MAERPLGDPFYDAPVDGGSGLLSGNNYGWQEGVRIMADGIGDCAFDPSMSGYEGIDGKVHSLVQSKKAGLQVRFVSFGHSNRNYYITEVARRLQPYGIECCICCIDRTMKACPELGANVIEALDLWAGPPMKRLVPGPLFRGNLVQKEFLGESHLSIIDNRTVQALAIEFCRKWKLS